MPISGIGDNGQPGHLPQQARRGPIHQTHQEEQENGAIQAHHQVQPQPVLGVERPLQQVGEDEQHVQHDGLHGVEPNVPAEAGVADHGEVKGEEDEEAVEREGMEELDGGKEGAKEELDGGELVDDVLAVVDAVEEGVEVAGGGEEAVRGVCAGGVGVVSGVGGDGRRPEVAAAAEGGDGGGRGGADGDGEESCHLFSLVGRRWNG